VCIDVEAIQTFGKGTLAPGGVDGRLDVAYELPARTTITRDASN